MTRWVAVTVLVMSVSTLAAESDDRSQSPYFFIEGGDESVDKLPLESTKVNVEVSGVIASVKVTQRYVNRGTRPINARYIFPASTRAAVNGMAMTIGDRRVEAKIKERAEARETYEKAKSEGKNAALLEQDRPNVFRLDVANVMPKDIIDVELRYTELLVPTDSVYEFRYPTVVGPRYAGGTGGEHDSFIHSPFLSSDREPVSDFFMTGTISTGVPVQDLGSSSHQVGLDWKSTEKVGFALSPKEKRSGNRDFVLRYRLRGAEVQSGLMLYEQGNEKYFMLTAQPPKRVEAAMMPPREFIFIIDVSGSMHGFPLETAKALLDQLALTLRPQDRFNIVRFSGDARMMSNESSLPATEANLKRARKYITDTESGGGTELVPAMKMALAIPRHENMARSLVVITDGFIGTEREVFTTIRNTLGDANVFSFGIGSSINHYLVDGVAKAGMGEPFVITSPSEVEQAVSKFSAYISSPVLAHVKLRAEGLELYDVEPSHIPDVMADRPVVVVGKYRGDAKGTLSIEGDTGRGRYTQDFSLKSVKPSPMNAPLRQLWARTRIAAVSDYGDDVPAEVTKLGLEYSLLTKYTSFVAVSEMRRHSGQATDVEQPQPMPENVSNEAVGTTVGAEPELMWLLAAALGLVAVWWQRQRSAA